MTLPLLLSVPHAGLEIPESVRSKCSLTLEEIVRDGDEGAREIYDLRTEVDAFVTTEVARAILDMNRDEGDRRKDGVVKTHTCWDVPVYRESLPEDLVQRLFEQHYRPYHRDLTALGGQVRLGVDCHTMATHGPPVGPDPGVERPLVCLGDGDGACPRPWVERLQTCLARVFPGRVTINDPFRGGYITRTHGTEMPWVQIELSRTSDMTHCQKREAVLAALTEFCGVI